MHPTSPTDAARSCSTSRLVLVGLVLELASLVPLAAAELVGRVIAEGGTPVEHARIEVVGTAGVTYSDRDGGFVLADVVFPAELLVTHQRFERRQVEVLVAGRQIEVSLAPRREVFETIAVSARRGDGGFAPVSVAASVVRPAEAAVAPLSVTELLSAAPAVAENGQGGLFQTYSVRGVARQRVLTLVAGMRVVGERRAGVSASFIDPALLAKAEVVRGPSSSYYGSGALGGVVQLFARRFSAPRAEIGWSSEGDGVRALAGGVAGAGSWGLAWRRAGRAEAPGGEVLNSGFDQISGSYVQSWSGGGLEVDLAVLAAAGRDIGKANTDFPQRLTEYPRERHLLTKLAVRRPERWTLELAAHPNTLETRVVEASGGRSELDNRAYDVAVSWQHRLEGRGGASGRLGLDYFGRLGVTSRELAFDASGGAGRKVEEGALDGAREDEFGLFTAWERGIGAALLSVGGRLAWQQQSNGSLGGQSETAFTAFAGLVAPLGRGSELVANAGTGLRFPSLSERFFSGTTGRGSAIGNLGLEPEKAASFDLGVRAWGKRWFVAAFAFRTEIDDYIERVELEPDVLTFVNLAAGRIEGLEIEGFVELRPGLTVEFTGHSVDGRDRDGAPLADSPADRVSAGLRGERGRWRWRLRSEHRASKSDAGSGEKAIPAADLVAASLALEVRPGLTVELAGRNLLDERYFSSADRKAPLSARRSLALGLRWRGASAGL